jgi:hypothetical protein
MRSKIPLELLEHTTNRLESCVRNPGSLQVDLPDRMAESELDAAIPGIEPGRVDAYDVACPDRYVEISENALEVRGVLEQGAILDRETAAILRVIEERIVDEVRPYVDAQAVAEQEALPFGSISDLLPAD